MNEDELKSRLKKDAEAFEVDFSEPLFHRIMALTENSPVSDVPQVLPKSERKKRFDGSWRSLGSLTIPAVRWAAVILIGLGLWGLWGVYNPAGRFVRNVSPASFTTLLPQTQNPYSAGRDAANSSSFTNFPGDSSGTIFNLTDESGIPILLSSADWDVYTHDLPLLAKSFFTNMNFVQNSLSAELGPTEEGSEDRSSISELIHSSSLVLNAPVGWIFEEDTL